MTQTTTKPKPTLEDAKVHIREAIAALNAAAVAMEDFRDNGQIAEFALDRICACATEDAEWLSTIAAQLDDAFIYCQ